jgi:hypothetical protein
VNRSSQGQWTSSFTVRSRPTVLVPGRVGS